MIIFIPEYPIPIDILPLSSPRVTAALTHEYTTILQVILDVDPNGL